MLTITTGKNTTETMNPDGPKLTQVDFDETSTHTKFTEQADGVIDDFLHIRILTVVKGKNVAFELRNPGGVVQVFVPIERGKPGND